jgi:hypothetical protein
MIGHAGLMQGWIATRLFIIQWMAEADKKRAESDKKRAEITAGASLTGQMNKFKNMHGPS